MSTSPYYTTSKAEIVEIVKRMGAACELYLAQGFPADYIIDHDIDGKPFSKAAQIARCGNSVSPKMAEALVLANVVEQPARRAA